MSSALIISGVDHVKSDLNLMQTGYWMPCQSGLAICHQNLISWQSSSALFKRGVDLKKFAAELHHHNDRDL